jgi:hypothetical protein
MPVEYCSRCKSLRTMKLATSNVRVLLRDGNTADVMTKTFYCCRCSSLLLTHEGKKLPAIGRPSRRHPTVMRKRPEGKGASVQPCQS